MPHGVHEQPDQKSQADGQRHKKERRRMAALR
jgi:hypothetical protein